MILLFIIPNKSLSSILLWIRSHLHFPGAARSLSVQYHYSATLYLTCYSSSQISRGREDVWGRRTELGEGRIWRLLVTHSARRTGETWRGWRWFLLSWILVSGSPSVLPSRQSSVSESIQQSASAGSQRTRHSQEHPPKWLAVHRDSFYWLVSPPPYPSSRTSPSLNMTTVS